MRGLVARVLATAGAVAVVAGLGAGAGSAAASVRQGRAPGNQGCGQEIPNCGTLLVYRPYHQYLALQARAATVGSPVVIMTAYRAQALQDWTFESLGTVANSVGRRGQLGITGYDISKYGADHVIRLELTPGGRKSRLCAAKSGGALVLQRCHVTAAQVFIEARSANGNGAIVGHYLLSLVQAPHVKGQHEAATGSYIEGRQVRFNTAVSSDLQYWFQQDELFLITVPSVIGDDASTAADELGSRHFKVVVVESGGPGNPPPGDVWDQTPPPGGGLPPGGTVTIYVEPSLSTI
jgi:hypothetical protein